MEFDAQAVLSMLLQTIPLLIAAFAGYMRLRDRIVRLETLVSGQVRQAEGDRDDLKAIRDQVNGLSRTTARIEGKMNGNHGAS